MVELEAFGTNAAASTASSSNIHWLVTDQVGTPRMIVDHSGTFSGVTRRDYLPFGEEISGEVGFFRTSANGYSDSDRVRQKFSSKERDIETGLDYFLARYYSSAQGRFVSPDEFSGGPTELFAEVAAHNPTFYADLGEPQSLNKYHYTLNNPFRFIDPDGHQGTLADAAMRGAAYAAQHPIEATKAVGGFVKEAWKGEAKAIGDIGIGMNNMGAIALRQPESLIEPFGYAEGNAGQEYGYRVMTVLTLLAPMLSKAGPANVFAAESRDAATVSAKTYQTYTKTNPTTNEVYVGRTSGTGTPQANVARRDAGHARTAQGFGPAVLDKSSSNAGAIRGREQQLIEYFRNAGTGADQINGVGPRNPNAKCYAVECLKEFKAMVNAATKKK